MAAEAARHITVASAERSCSSVTAGTPVDGNWTLLWHDEFCCSGASADAVAPGREAHRSAGGIDTRTWSFDLGNRDPSDPNAPPGWGNNEPQFYTDRAVNARISTDDGGDRCVLVIQAQAEPYLGFRFTSARITTKAHPVAGALQPPPDGKLWIEVRAKLPAGTPTGTWPAFWLLPSSKVYGGWPEGGEIDVLEAAAMQGHAVAAAHFGGPGFEALASSSRTVTCLGPDGAAVPCNVHYYTWALEWSADALKWYMDGTSTHVLTRDEWWSGAEAAAARPSAPFDQPFHLILNLAAGGAFAGGDPPAGEPYKQVFQVDWVRVYQSPAAPSPSMQHDQG